jgi:hypothetical protein
MMWGHVAYGASAPVFGFDEVILELGMLPSCAQRSIAMIHRPGALPRMFWLDSGGILRVVVEGVGGLWQGHEQATVGHFRGAAAVVIG